MSFWSFGLILMAIAAQPQPPREPIGPILDELTAPLIEQGQVNRLIVAGFRGNQDPVIRDYPNQASGDPVTPPTAEATFEIGSITKVFTGILLAEAIERGEVKPNTPASDLLPENVTMPGPQDRPITLLDLTTHLSGLPRLPGNLTPLDPVDPYAKYDQQRMYEFLGQCQLASQPGERYAYSNLGVGLLGHLLAERAGQSYESLLRERIWKPLGMSQTFITVTERTRARVVTGHNASGQEVSGWNFDALAGAGAIRSTISDMLIFLQAQLDPQSTPIGSSLRRALQIQTELGVDQPMGLGWILPGATSSVRWHNGGTGGFSSFAAIDLEQKVGVVVLSNRAISQPVTALGFQILTRLGTDQAQERVAIVLDPKTFDAYVGTYRLVPGFELTFTREGDRFFIQATGQAKLEIFPESKTDFFLKAVEAQVSFQRNQEGEVDAVILRQNGVNQRATRIDEI